MYGDHMSECVENCQTCQNECIKRCPVCKKNATPVPLDTVKEILKDTSELIEEDIYMCLNHNCEVTYFNTKQYYVKEELKVPVWFKENPREMTVCYCYGLSFDMIVKAVQKGFTTKDDIIKYYQLEEKKKDCSHRNPIGKTCDKLFDNVIAYAKGEENEHLA